MGLFDKVKSSISERSQKTTGIIDYGETTSTGGHDHRYNKGDDRTRAQKEADKAKRQKD